MGYEEIIKQRTDMSKYLLHWTTKEGFESIIKTGFFKATFAPRGNPGNSTIYGDYPAVCFSETPIGNYFQSLCVEKRYWKKRWLLALSKRALYGYGGRPVIYGDSSFENRLDIEDKYLFSHFDLEKPIDWAHEREWRVKPNVETNKQIFSSDSTHLEEYVPFHLNEQGKPITDTTLPVKPRFFLVVEQEKDIVGLKNHILLDFFKGGVAPNDYVVSYFLAFTNVKIFSLDRIKNDQIQDIDDLLLESTELNRIEELGELWDDWHVEIRRQIINNIRELLPPADFKFERHAPPMEYCDWYNIPGDIQRILNGNSEKIRNVVEDFS